MTMLERAEHFRFVFRKWPASWPWAVQETDHTVLYGVWVIGNDYRNKTQYYGAYPPGYLARVMAFFPDVPQTRETVLHVFSGSLPASDAYARCDSVKPSEWGMTVDALAVRCPIKWRLIIADPPYSAADAEKYGTRMIHRGRTLQQLADVTAAGGHLCWLDTVWPMHRKTEWRTVGRILVQRSTNHRVRLLTIFERQS